MLNGAGIAAGAAIVAACAWCPAEAQTKAVEPKFPLVLTAEVQLHPFGLDLRAIDSDRAPAFAHVCYAYGGEAHTVYLMSMSDAFLKRHTDRGFSRESVCLGLVSQVRFDPDTGRRLPTYVIKYPEKVAKALAAAKKAKLPPKETQWALMEDGGITDELPLVLPDCFRNGTPYLDCVWRFGWQSGKPISEGTRKAASDYGLMFDDMIRRGMAAGLVKSGESPAVKGYLAIAGYLAPSTIGAGPADEDRIFKLHERGAVRHTWTAVSPNLPRGYGTAMNASGELGPSVSVEAVTAALDATGPPPQVTEAMVDRLLGWLGPKR